MRLGESGLCVVLVALGACGDDGGGPSACDVGPQIVGEAVSSLLATEPRCQNDDECVFASFDVACGGYLIESCPAIVHRDTAALWNEAAVCKRIEQASAPSQYACTVSASCSAMGAPVCRAGGCVGSN